MFRMPLAAGCLVLTSLAIAGCDAPRVPQPPFHEPVAATAPASDPAPPATAPALPAHP